MKTLFSTKLIFGAGLVVLAIIGGRALQGSNAQSQASAPSAPAVTASATATPSAPDASTVTTTAPVIPVTPAVLPSNISPTSPLAQVIRLAQAGVDQSVIMTYVTNSGGTFNLDSDTIIYLSDLGVPNELVTAMMQHDQQLQQPVAINQNPPPVQQPAAPEPEPVAQPEQQPVTVNYFYDTLTPYGSWVEVAGYGRCWRPTVVMYDSDWQPYCDRGHWVYTDCGWYWTSDYSWGSTFHYGRWFRDARIGWCWWPDTVWSPSWVTWRYSTDYCGWAPLPPFTTCGSGGYYYRGAAVGVGFNFGLSVNFFTFVPTRNFCDPHPRHYRADHAQVTRIYNNTTVINNIDVDHHRINNHGISPGSITSVTHTPVRQIPVRELGNPAANGNHGANRTAFTGNHNAAGQIGAPMQNQPRPQPSQLPHNNRGGQVQAGNPVTDQQQPSTHNQNRPQSQRNDAVTTTSPRPAPGVDRRAATPDARVQTSPAQQFNQQPATPRWQQQQQPDQSQRLDTPRNSTRNPQVRQNTDVPVQPRYGTPSVNYSAPPQSQPEPRSFSQPRNEPRMDQPRQSYSPPPAAPVERQQNYEARQSQSYSAPAPRNDPPAAPPAPAPSQRSSQQDSNQHGPKH
jgi:hypothetical protein